jgi:hypothetical protein
MYCLADFMASQPAALASIGSVISCNPIFVSQLTLRLTQGLRQACFFFAFQNGLIMKFILVSSPDLILNWMAGSRIKSS